VTYNVDHRLQSGVECWSVVSDRRAVLSVQDFRAFSPVHQVELQLASVKEAGRLKLTLQLPQNAFTYVVTLTHV